MLTISEKGKRWLSALEGGPRLQSYQDTGGVWMVGVGMTVNPITKQPVGPNTKLASAEEAYKLFDLCLDSYEEAVDGAIHRHGDLIRHGGPLTANVTDALISFCYNIGIGAFRSSTALKRFNANFPVSSICEAISWFKKPNLVSRRWAEIECFAKGRYVDQAGRLTK